jgi:hypothetical protein
VLLIVLIILILLIKSTSLVLKPLVKDRVKPLIKPMDPSTLPRTFVAFSNIDLNTSFSPNVKVVQFVKGHNFHVEWHFKFEA